MKEPSKMLILREYTNNPLNNPFGWSTASRPAATPAARPSAFWQARG